jgi:hypothetical protein
LRDVWVGGRCRVRGGMHAGADEAARRFVAARATLLKEA